MVRGDGAFRHLGQPDHFVSGVRREGQHLRETTGATMPALRRRGATQRDAFLPDLRRHGLVACQLN
jgi:hypothetical protein